MTDIDQIKERILSLFDDAEVHILDPRNDGVHLEAIVISKHFEGLSLIKQQQMIMKGLSDFFETSLHALGLKTYTPEKWEKEKNHD